MKDPLRHHNHRHKNQGVPFEQCPRCAFDKAVCEKKILLHTWVEAHEWVLEYNIEHGWRPPLMTYYRCRWCGGYHMNTCRDKRDRVRAERWRRQWMVEFIEQDEEAFRHWVRTGEVRRVNEIQQAQPGAATSGAAGPATA